MSRPGRGRLTLVDGPTASLADGHCRPTFPRSARSKEFTSHSELELGVDGAGLRLEPVTSNERSVAVSDGIPLLGFVQGARVTDDDIRRLRDDTNR